MNPLKYVKSNTIILFIDCRYSHGRPPTDGLTEWLGVSIADPAPLLHMLNAVSTNYIWHSLTNPPRTANDREL